MAQKITRKDLKRNELAETVNKTVGFVSLHKKGVTETTAIAIAVAAVAAGIVAYRLYIAAAAGHELSAALEILSTPIAGQPNASGAAKTYPSAAERDKEADAHLRKAAAHSSTSAGRAAAVILAARDPKAPGTADALMRVAREGKAEVAAAAEIDAARWLAAQGRTVEAADRLKRAIESQEIRAPKDSLLFALGEIYEKAGQTADARAAFQRLVNDYPNSPYRADARSKLPGAQGPGAFNPS